MRNIQKRTGTIPKGLCKPKADVEQGGDSGKGKRCGAGHDMTEYMTEVMTDKMRYDKKADKDHKVRK